MDMFKPLWPHGVPEIGENSMSLQGNEGWSGVNPAASLHVDVALAVCWLAAIPTSFPPHSQA